MKLKIKGINDGLLMILPNLSWQACCDAVLDTIGNNSGFYTGANLFLDAGDLEIRVVEITSLRSELENSGILLKGIFSHNERTIQNCRSLGLITEQTVKKESFRKEVIEESEPIKAMGEPAYFINRTIRSGTVVERKETIVIIGDVNPGAEVISEKNIIVLGMVRGRLSAGESVGSSAYIAAKDFDNAQVSIGGVMSLIRREDLGKKTSDLLMVRNKYGVIEIDTK